MFKYTIIENYINISTVYLA